VPVLKSFASGRLFGSTWGDGRPSVLALHGWQRRHQDFSAVFADLPAGSPAVLAVDLPGFGATPPPDGPWGTPEYATALLDVLDEMEGPVTVLGHSFGGRVAVRLAAAAPDRIDRLVLTGVPLLDRQGRRSRPATAYRIGRRLHRLGLVGDDRMEALRNRYGSPDYRAATGVVRQVFVKIVAERYDEDLRSIVCPDLVWGADDREVPLEVAERAVPLLRSPSLRVLPGVGHLTPTEAPEALRAAVTGGPG
jgi:pimeloyl-ACP methyl ester carboxylesterase